MYVLCVLQLDSRPLIVKVNLCMGHKKFPFLVYIKLSIYSCNGNETFGTQHGSFNSELNSPFNGKFNDPFKAAFACFQSSEMIKKNWFACYCGRRYRVRIRVCVCVCVCVCVSV